LQPQASSMRDVSTVLPAERARADAIAFLIDA
jgi:hypothetical protein